MFAAIDAATTAAVFTGLALLISSVGAFFLSWRAAINAEKARQEAVAAKEKTEVIVAKTDTLLTETAKIHTLTNDAKSKADAALAVANETIKGLQMLNASLAGKQAPAPPPKPPSSHPFK